MNCGFNYDPVLKYCVLFPIYARQAQSDAASRQRTRILVVGACKDISRLNSASTHHTVDGWRHRCSEVRVSASFSGGWAGRNWNAGTADVAETVHADESRCAYRPHSSTFSVYLEGFCFLLLNPCGGQEKALQSKLSGGKKKLASPPRRDCLCINHLDCRTLWKLMKHPKINKDWNRVEHWGITKQHNC